MPKANRPSKARPPRTRRPAGPGKKPLAPPKPVPTAPGFGPSIELPNPQFGEPSPSSDPTKFLDQKSDLGYYALVNKTLLQPIPPPRDPAFTPDKLILTLEQAYGNAGPEKVKAIQSSGQIVFHSVGDTGPTKGPATITMVANKMVADFNEANPADVPAFFYHLGDVVYSFGEGEYYFDQFYEPYRDYPAPIFAIPGNHDGVTYKGDPAASLAAFLRNFCSDKWTKPPEAGGLPRTTMIQPAVYFRLDAPFVRILGLYSNVLEGPGVISSQGNKSSNVSYAQIDFLNVQLGLLKKESYRGAVILAVHHPPFTAGAGHGGSPRMLQDLDQVFKSSGVYPHAVISGHAHNYQRFTRTEGNRQTPYVISGSGGHAANPLRSGSNSTPIRTPLDMTGLPPSAGKVRLETYFAQFGYLRVVVTAKLLSIEFHEVGSSINSKAPIDVVTVDLQSRALTTTRP